MNLQKGESEQHIEVQNLISRLEIGQGDHSVKEQCKTSTCDVEESKISNSMEEQIKTTSKEEQSKSTNEKKSKTLIINEEQSKTTTSNEEPSKTPNEKQSRNPTSDEVQTLAPVTVMVLGAGRGPLVRATFNASDITNTKVKVRRNKESTDGLVTSRLELEGVSSASEVMG